MARDAPVAAGSAVTPVSPVFMALLVGMTALAPLSMQIFVPALPAIQRGFGVSTGIAQLALSLSILANAIATLSYGPLSDRFGRRPVVLGGLSLFVVGSLMCTVAPTIGLLILGRIVQAAGGAAGMVIARAIVRDLYDRDRAAAAIAYLTMAMVVAPMLAPSVGAILMGLSDWRAIFVALTVIGILLVWGTQLRLVETRAGGSGGSGWGSLLAGGGRLLRSPAFLGYVLQTAFSMSMFFAFVSGAPYFIIDVLGRPALEYGLYFMLVSVGYMSGNFTAARITRRVGIDRMILIGSALSLVGTSLVAGLLLSLPWAPVLLFGPMMLTSYANGLAMPNGQAGAISVDPALAGTASGVAGFAQLLCAALVSQAVGMVQNGTPYPMLAFMVGCAALSLLGFVLPRWWAGKTAR
jgi:DHA1 family bicyclomycin/chloramphenicol resistance-like MFS transporter